MAYFCDNAYSVHTICLLRTNVEYSLYLLASKKIEGKEEENFKESFSSTYQKYKV